MRGTYVLPQRHHHPKLGMVFFIAGVVISLIVIGIAISGAFKLPIFNFQPQVAVPAETQEKETSKESIPETEVSGIDVSNTTEMEVQKPIETQAEETTAENTETTDSTEIRSMVNEMVSDTPQQDVPTEEIIITIPKDNFIVGSELWKRAVIVHKTDNNRFPGIGFIDLTVGTKLYTPIDGYINIYRIEDGNGNKNSVIAISTDKNWGLGKKNDNPSVRVVFFSAFDIKCTAYGEVKIGQEIGELASENPYCNNQIKETISMSFSPDVPWHQMLESPSDDPMKYMKQLLEVLIDIKNSGGGK